MDFVEPLRARVAFFDWVPCTQDAYDGYTAQVATPNFNLGYDVTPPQYFNHLVDGAWAYSTGTGVVIGSTDTGIDVNGGCDS